MTEWMWRIMLRYGQKITIQAGETSVSARAFLQPMTQRSERAREAVTPIGWTDGRLWLYLGQTPLEETDTLRWNGLNFRVRSCRPYFVGERLSHYWAALELEREAAECGS